MHDPEKSDSGIVATKPTNKAGRPVAEPGLARALPQAPPKVRFAVDSPLEEAGFEPRSRFTYSPFRTPFLSAPLRSRSPNGNHPLATIHARSGFSDCHMRRRAGRVAHVAPVVKRQSKKAARSKPVSFAMQTSNRVFALIPCSLAWPKTLADRGGNGAQLRYIEAFNLSSHLYINAAGRSRRPTRN